jgi:hypothetical protein
VTVPVPEVSASQGLCLWLSASLASCLFGFPLLPFAPCFSTVLGLSSGGKGPQGSPG